MKTFQVWHIWDYEIYIHNQIEPFAFEHNFWLQVLKISSSYFIVEWLTQKMLILDFFQFELKIKQLFKG